jgi:hypothetical protein
MSIEAMKQALEALKMCRGLIRNNIAEGVAISSPNPFFSADVDNAITTLRTAIEKAEKQEPVAYAVYHRMGGSKTLHWPEQHSEDGDAKEYKLVPLYTTQPYVATPLAAQPAYTKEDLDRAFSAGLVEGEKLAFVSPAAPVQEPDLTEIPMIMTCTKCGAFGEAMLTLETQPAQKPVNVTSKMVQAFLYAAGRHFPWGGSDPAIEDGIKAALEAMPTPPAAQRQSARSAWVGLSEEEILKLAYPIRWQEVDDFEADKAINFAQTIEAKLREKNGGAA